MTANLTKFIITLAILSGSTSVKASYDDFSWASLDGCIEITHWMLVGLNIVSDILVIQEMKSVRQSVQTMKQIVRTSPSTHAHAFCYPKESIPPWFKPSYSQCSCSVVQIDCNRPFNSTNARFEGKVTCGSQFLAFGTPRQTILTFSHWVCQDCRCNTSVYAWNSIPSTFLREQHATLSVGLQKEYCNPSQVSKFELPQIDLGKMITWAIAFAVIGTVITCGSSLCRTCIMATGGTDTYSKNQSSTRMRSALRLAAQFISSVFQDIPHTIITILLSAYLYVNHGYYCQVAWVKSPSVLSAIVTTNPGIGIGNIQLHVTGVTIRNTWQITFSLVSSCLIVLFNGAYQGYSFANTFVMERIGKDDPEYCAVLCLSYIGFGFVAFFYICVLVGPTLGVTKYFLMPLIHEQWLIVTVFWWMTVAGVGLGLCGCCVICSCMCVDKSGDVSGVLESSAEMVNSLVAKKEVEPQRI